MIASATTFGLFLGLVNSVIDNPKQEWVDYFPHRVFLNEAEEYLLYWKINETAEYVELAIEAETSGWVGFGISDNGLMIEADIVLGWIDESGEAFLQRRHTTTNRVDGALFDENIINDLIESEYDSNLSITRLRFYRELYPCPDDNNPIRKQIVLGTTQVIFATNNDNPVCNTDGQDNEDKDYGDDCTLSMHPMNKMGKKALNLHSAEMPVIELPQDAENYTFTMDNYNLEPVDTIYYCKFLEMPNPINELSHLIRIDPVIQVGNEGTVHHSILYRCSSLNESYIGFEAKCNEFANMPDFEGKNCRGGEMIMVWAVGRSNFYFPENTGYPIQGKVYAMLEIHYDNPDERGDIIDSSGFAIYWTPTLRETNTSHTIVAAPYSAQFIPGNIPQGTLIKHAFHSIPKCTADFPEEGVYAFAGTLHAHTVGVAITFRHIRNNIELEPIMINKQYDFNFQEYAIFPEPIQILPGDEFICECTYDTNIGDTSRYLPTYGGETTRDEMCNCRLMIYPQINWASWSYFSTEQWIEFFDVAINKGWFNGTNSWSENAANKNSFYDASNPQALQHYLDFINVKERMVSCLNGDVYEAMIIPEAREQFVAREEDDLGACLEEESSEDKGLSTTEIIIIFIVVGVVVLILVFISLWYCKSKRKGKDYQEMTDQQDYGTTTK
eukprot:243155_1